MRAFRSFSLGVSFVSGASWRQWLTPVHICRAPFPDLNCRPRPRVNPRELLDPRDADALCIVAVAEAAGARAVRIESAPSPICILLNSTSHSIQWNGAERLVWRGRRGRRRRWRRGRRGRGGPRGTTPRPGPTFKRQPPVQCQSSSLGHGAKAALPPVPRACGSRIGV